MAEGRSAGHGQPLVTATHALNLLTVFSDEHPELGVTELSERLGLAKSIVSRIVTTYVAEGVLVQDEMTRRYRLGPLLLELGLIAGELHPVFQAADAPVKALRDETGQNTLLWLRGDSEEMLCLASHRGAKAVAPPIPAGTRIKLSDSVVGQAMLGRARVTVKGADLFDRPSYTAACCIEDSRGEVVAAIAVSATDEWFRSQPTGRVDAAIVRAALEVSARLG